MLLKRWQALRDKAYLKNLLVILAIAIIGLSTVGNYGITWDETVEVDMVRWNLDYIRSDKPIERDSKYYGFYFNYISQLIHEATEEVARTLNPDSVKEPAHITTDRQRWVYQMWKHTRTKHVVTFLFSLIAYASVIGIVSILAGKENAWLGAIVLALFPGFWGHSFFNPKDIPFATMFTLATLGGSKLLNLYFSAELSTLSIGKNRVTIGSFIFGILVGLVTGIRVGGFFLLSFIIMAQIVAKPDLKSVTLTLRRFWKFYGLIFLGWAVTCYIIYPSAWRNPVDWFIGAVTTMSNYSLWNNDVLFDGQYIPGRSLPWYYLPRLISITVPVLFQVAFIGGIIAIAARYKGLTPAQRGCAVLTLLQAFILPSLAIIKGSTMYDGMRHSLFVLPAMAAIATTALIWLYEKLPRKPKLVKIFAVTLLITNLGVIAYDMLGLHPYEYAYFNRAYGGLRGAFQKQETDYWGLSLREATEWFNKNAEPNSSLVVAGPGFGFEMYVDPALNIHMTHRDDFQWGKAPDPDYYMGIHRYDYYKAFPQCPIVHAVTRQETSLAIIRKCSTN
ncbi:MAG: hypothetical protein N5P05_001869 [Chroococcopsis gigantea SAG 12.99]|jgi:hypothetical protein|nr:hypothetical protein [Chlorogloea purpurea SAG 13.99]MDV3000263.1 hypothetical protein [Chroococcopsis gigantea SAG 12.99]